MQFCTQCGGALNLFESNDDKVCWNCVRKQQKQAPPKNATTAVPDEDALHEATFSLESDTLTLRAKEGWVLWSGPADKKVSLGTVLNRARRIYSIRKKRHNPKN